MQKDNLDTHLLATRELTDAELMQIQGGGFFGDVFNAVKNAVTVAAHAVVNTVVTQPIDAVRQLIDQISKLGKLGRTGPFGGGPGQI